MASVTSNISTTSTGFSGKLSNFFSAVSVGLVAYMERRSRSEVIARLQAKSDAELAKLGIKRDEIPAYVFRDLFYV
ncbi:hypothetical protein DL237_15195 [Pseudooceanicola sediminis]|uniref:DUF1127 domain-containing protein n=1 Tax=Pseudooceanicola sediminis TaxID=2211117 RepID=A0A399IX19_9RHOB|nr:hypothetical protein [Pseudooceanicola sediminis]KAA2313100.1 hypothetical protein E0K93_14825 [Puniceibacterium sp. HSS470]RII37748.1 hypothetical protein DL237_15195 [Pseudooceanicola sediminis]